VEIDADVTVLAEEIIEKLPLPRKAGADALHIAAATCASVDFLLTWSCAHIANAELRPGIERVCREQGYAARGHPRPARVNRPHRRPRTRS
jgi:hypothetical protein